MMTTDEYINVDRIKDGSLAEAYLSRPADDI